MPNTLNDEKTHSPKKQKSSMLSLGIRARIFLAFSFVVVILIGSAIIVETKIDNSKQFARRVVNIDLPSQDISKDLGIQLAHQVAAINGWAATDLQGYRQDYMVAEKLVNNDLDQLKVFAKQWNDTQSIKEVESLNELYYKLSSAYEKLLASDNTLAVKQLDEPKKILDQMLDILDGPINASGNRENGLFSRQFAILNTGASQIIRDMDSLKITETILIIIGIIFSLLIAYLTSKSILKNINLFRQHSSRIASGDLRQRLQIDNDDEISLLGTDLNSMTDSLAGITQQITTACHNMVTTLEEVRHAVDAQSAGASEQASSINEITASLAEIEKSSNQTIEKTKALGSVAERTREKGQVGLAAVEQSILGMKMVREKVQIIAQTILDLSHQTQQVGEITAVVNSLSQQSKMLALNASIEAAKAGEAGKGFAVVAVEVKNLAEQSEQSTTQVQKILEDIRHATEKAVMVTEEGTKGVDHGTGLVEQTGEIVRSLTDVIHETMIATQQIEAAVRQESVGIEQITLGMNEINQVTASFVDSVKQTTEAMTNLAGITKSLKKFIDVYKV